MLTCGLDDPGGGLGRLYGALGPALARATPGWEAEERALRPHVTVARVRARARPRVGSEPNAPALRFSAASLALMRSDLGPGGPVYEPLERRVLRSAA